MKNIAVEMKNKIIQINIKTNTDGEYISKLKAQFRNFPESSSHRQRGYIMESLREK